MKEENPKDNTVLVVTLLTSTVLQINHPGRNQPLQYSDYHCTAATPPSKGGENVMNERNCNINNRLPLLILPVEFFFKLLRLTAIGQAPPGVWG
ncbi:MAG: hypothetical protein A2X03_03140 [Bacteroidetes bacterium GWA2_40_15]|nr:MAG: hypothetical protein A2X03_03140 [Bacteroidetes bacterium GWA2_40_15]OFY00882.1 MAG: hypothetical protein A2X06_05065 [Bacteroidetes bacterium GWC2_40_22]